MTEPAASAAVAEPTVRETIQAARERVETLAVEDGQYFVACRRTGVRPEPVTDARFDCLADATRARDAVVRYRDALSTLDPDCSRFDLDVYEVDGADVSVAHRRETTAERRDNGLPASEQSVLVTGERVDEWLQVTNGPVVHVASDGALLDDEVVSRQLDEKL